MRAVRITFGEASSHRGPRILASVHRPQEPEQELSTEEILILYHELAARLGSETKSYPQADVIDLPRFLGGR